jgi:hypothetical protein
MPAPPVISMTKKNFIQEEMSFMHNLDFSLQSQPKASPGKKALFKKTE